MKGKKISVFRILNYLILSVLVVICLIPVLHVIALSFSEKIEAVSGNVGIWPVGFNLSAYRYVMEDWQFWHRGSRKHYPCDPDSLSAFET